MTVSLNPSPVVVDPFDFPTWQTERWARWQGVTLQIAARLLEGFGIREEWASGAVTVWSLDGNYRPDDPGHRWQPFITDRMTAEYIAEHLSTRAQGFGTTLTVEV